MKYLATGPPKFNPLDNSCFPERTFIFEMSNIFKSNQRFIGTVLMFYTFAVNVTAQVPSAAESSGVGMGLTLILIVLAVAVVGFLVWKRNAKPAQEDKNSYANREQRKPDRDHYDEGVDAEKELECFRKAKQTSKSTVNGTAKPKKISKTAVELTGLMQNGQGNGNQLQAQAKAFQEKMKRLQYSQLPINSFLQLTDPKPFDLLPLSSDPSLMNAIEQANEEFEDDESVRAVSVRVLAAFKTRNSVDALSQIALYDLSATVRSKAVTALTEFDHETVFESLLLACADPTREVRAAAARGLFRLSFDRADAWKRIIATRDEFRMIHAARAATEAGIVLKSFDRLLHDDMKIAYEAFALVGLLIKAGETEQIFSAIRESADDRVKFALLHVLSVIRDERSLMELKKIASESNTPKEIAAKMTEVAAARETVSA